MFCFYFREGKTLILKDDDSDVESRVQEKIRIKRIISKLQLKIKRKKSVSDNVLKESEKSKEIRRRPFIRKRRLQKSKENDTSKDSVKKVRHFLILTNFKKYLT